MYVCWRMCVTLHLATDFGMKEKHLAPMWKFVRFARTEIESRQQQDITCSTDCTAECLNSHTRIFALISQSGPRRWLCSYIQHDSLHNCRVTLRYCLTECRAPEHTELMRRLTAFLMPAAEVVYSAILVHRFIFIPLKKFSFVLTNKQIKCVKVVHRYHIEHLHNIGWASETCAMHYAWLT